MNLSDLSAPFPVEAIHWRAQSVYEERALALAYLDARDVMDRLDNSVGPDCWQDSYVETVKGRVICTLAIRVDNEWISKSDGAGDTAVEGEKGALSDALKRAAVKWGIGRYLYDLNNVWAPCVLNNGKWKAWAPGAEQVFKTALARVGRPTGPINDTTRDWLQAQLEASKVTAQDLLRHMAPQSLKDLTYEEVAKAQAFINSKKKDAA